MLKQKDIILLEQMEKSKRLCTILTEIAKSIVDAKANESYINSSDNFVKTDLRLRSMY